MDTFYRKKSLESLTNPEQLDDYIQVLNPKAWLVILSVIILLVGIIFWAIFGKAESKIKVASETNEGRFVCCIKSSDISKVSVGMIATVGNARVPIEGISDINNPVTVTDDEDFSEYFRSLGNLSLGEKVYVAVGYYDYDEDNVADSVADGEHEAYIVTDEISPISFLFSKQ